jgi:hypothetical protein
LRNELGKSLPVQGNNALFTQLKKCLKEIKKDLEDNYTGASLGKHFAALGRKTP